MFKIIRNIFLTVLGFFIWGFFSVGILMGYTSDPVNNAFQVFLGFFWVAGLPIMFATFAFFAFFRKKVILSIPIIYFEILALSFVIWFIMTKIYK